MKLVNVQEMKQLDQLATAEYAVPGILLMDNAAQAVADAVNDSLDELDGESVVVFAVAAIMAVMASVLPVGCKIMAPKYAFLLWARHWRLLPVMLQQSLRCCKKLMLR